MCSPLGDAGCAWGERASPRTNGLGYVRSRSERVPLATATKASRRAPRRAPHSRLVATPDLLVPRPPRPAMRRTRLFDALDAGSEGRIVLISAPAGAGKTALLSTWLAERPRRRV